MATALEYALMSEDVYANTRQSASLGRAGWRSQRPFEHPGIGLFSRTYIKDGTGETVVAVRGTDMPHLSGGIIETINSVTASLTDWVDNNIVWGIMRSNSQIRQMTEYATELLERLRPSVARSVTGHSLGGIVTHELCRANRGLVGVTFNSGGNYSVVERLQSWPIYNFCSIGDPLSSCVASRLLGHKVQLAVSGTGLGDKHSMVNLRTAIQRHPDRNKNPSEWRMTDCR